MSLDGVCIHALIEELDCALVGGRISKIYQTSRHEIIMEIRKGGDTLILLGSAHPDFARVHLIDELPQDFPDPSHFCTFLRKYLSKGKILEVSGENLERLLCISIETYDDFGRITKKKLIFELMGRRSNIILVNEDNVILDSIIHITKDVNRYREILPGHRYILPPPQEKKIPLELTKKTFEELISLGLGPTKASSFLLNNIQGIGPLLASEIVCRAGFPKNSTFDDIEKLAGDEARSNLWKGFNSIFQALRDKDYKPTLFLDSKNLNSVDFFIFELKQFQDLPKNHFDNISQLLDAFYTETAITNQLRDETSSLSRVLETNLARSYKKLHAQESEAENAQKADEFRLKGELLTANLYRFKKGQKKVTVTNYYDPEGNEITITLDPSLSPSENAQRFFKKYTRAKRGFEIIKEQMRSTLEEIDYLESVKLGLDRAENLLDLREIKEELVEAGYIKTAKPKKNKHKISETLQKPMVFSSTDGDHILVGKNNRQNDHLTMRMASPEDYWFHVKDIPGSHVILRTNAGQKPSDEALYQAATLAVFYSKARESANVPVDYTQRKNVKKPSGAKPGMVIYEKYNTIFLTPDIDLIEKLKAH